MPIARAVDRILVKDRKTGRRRLVKVKARIVDQWKNHSFPMNAAQAERFLRSKGVIEDGMIVIDY